MTMGQRIAERRKLLGISQETLGEKMGVSRQAISKWESDGAVPEVDKLIAMSRLFGVSVGWLLGVEDEPEKKNDGFSEEQLKLVEEIVKRYQPRKEKFSPKKKAVLIGLAVCLAAALIAFFSKWSNQNSILSYTYAQVQNINSQNANIQSQLSALSGRIDSLSGFSEPIEQLLAEYAFHVKLVDTETARVTFTAAPGLWQEGDTAYLVVRLNGEQTARQECQWDGTGYSVSVELALETGYEYYYVVCHADGTQEQQPVSDGTAYDLRSYATIDWSVTSGNWQWKRYDKVLSLTNYDLDVSMPGCAEEEETWELIEFVLRYNGEDLSAYDLLATIPAGTEKELTASPDLGFHSRDMEFSLPELQEGDKLELYIHLQLSNRIVTWEKVASWELINGQMTCEMQAPIVGW